MSQINISQGTLANWIFSMPKIRNLLVHAHYTTNDVHYLSGSITSCKQLTLVVIHARMQQELQKLTLPQK